jgi:hypothetical protein
MIGVTIMNGPALIKRLKGYPGSQNLRKLQG